MCVVDEYRMILVKEKKVANAFVGKEAFPSVEPLFSLTGPIPPFVIKHIHLIAESGM